MTKREIWRGLEGLSACAIGVAGAQGDQALIFAAAMMCYIYFRWSMDSAE